MQGPLSPVEDSFRVCDVIEGVSMWDFSKISLTLPSNTFEAIKAISVCSSRTLADRHVWDSNGVSLTLRRLILLLVTHHPSVLSLSLSLRIGFGMLELTLE